MKKEYIVPALKIERFHVENIMEDSSVDILRPDGLDDDVMGHIEFGDGNTLQSINYSSFTK